MKTLFKPEQFKNTQWDGAADKARFANHFVRFVESDFKSTLFPKWFYRRLSMTFGHIAHYDIHGFWATFFRDTHGKIAFLQQTAEWPCYGDPAYTYSDVEQQIRAWVKGSGYLAAYRAKLTAETEAAERAELARLQQKYGAPK